MKKFFIMAYARKNLGDDIFIKMLLEKYRQVNFYIKVPKYEYLEEMDRYENLHIIIGRDTDEELYNMNVEQYDGYVYVGGSIFMEGGKVYNLSPKFYDFVSRCKEKHIPFCYISSNYGPYQTEEYFNLSRANFKACTDICFRDRYSYELFKDIESVRYAPDFVFNYPAQITNKIPNSIGISLINLEMRENLKNVKVLYDKFIENNINRYIEEGNNVYLFSFCEHEGDEIALEEIFKKFHNNSNIIPVRYNGNVNEFLDIYSKMEYMICARFHAMILSCIYRQKAYVISYSKKINNVLEDLELNLPVMNYQDIEEDIEINKNDFVQIEEDKIQTIINKSKEQDKIFQEVVGN